MFGRVVGILTIWFNVHNTRRKKIKRIYFSRESHGIHLFVRVFNTKLMSLNQSTKNTLRIFNCNQLKICILPEYKAY